MGGETLFMTPEESARVQKTVQTLKQKCREQQGDPRIPNDAKSLIQQATGSSLMEDMASSVFGMAAQKSSPDTMPAYAVGCPYLPCTLNVSDLKPMHLSELCMETHHRGRRLTLSRVSPVVSLKASSWAAVQGETAEDVERLEVFLHKSRHGCEVLEMGSVFIIKEPYYTLNSQGEPVIRVDHPSDLIISAYSVGPESWRDANSASAPVTTNPAVCKEQGNAALGKKDYARAHACYSEGLRLVSENQAAEGTLLKDLHRNRSHVNLLLQRFDEAKADGLASLTKGNSENEQMLNAKAYYRAGTAAYNLGQFEDAKDLFQKQLDLEPDNRLGRANLKRLQTRLNEKSHGSYDLNKVVSSLNKTQGRADVASYNGDTEVKKSPGAGRGLFATRAFKAGEIVMCEKAFCVVWGHETEAFSALTCDLRNDALIRVFPAGLHRAVVQKLLNNPSHVEKVLDLYSDHEGLGDKLLQQDGGPVIDTFQVHDIVQRNAFGPGKQTEDEDVTNASTGLWVRAAYINHSCAPNTKKDYVGDLMLLRATRKIAKGDEITHSYDETSDLEARAAALEKTWGFKCKCALCAAEEADGPDLRKKRLALENEASSLIQKESPSQTKKLTISKARRLQQALKDTYNDKRYKDLPRHALVGLEHWLQAASSR